MEPRGLGLTSPTPTNYWPLFAHTLQLLYSFKTKCLHSIILSSSLVLKSKNHIFTLHIHHSVTDQPLCTFTSNSINKFSLKNVILYHFMYKNCRVTPIKHILIQKNLYRDEAEKIQKMRYLWYNLYVLLLEPKQFSCLQDSVGPRPLGKIAFSSLTIDEHDQSTSPSLWPWPIVTDHSESWCDMMWLFLCFRDQWKRVSRKGKFFFI